VGSCPATHWSDQVEIQSALALIEVELVKVQENCSGRRVRNFSVE
jgi:hypothetical protein